MIFGHPQIPKTKPLIPNRPLPLTTRIIQHNQRLREKKRCFLQIKRAPVSGLYVLVCFNTLEGGGQQIPDLAAFQIVQCLFNMGQRKMHQAVAHQYTIHFGQRIRQQIQVQELPLVIAIMLLILGNQGFHNIAARIMDTGKIHLLHPVKIAAGKIQQGSDAIVTQECGKF